MKRWCDVCKISSLSLTRKWKPGGELLVSSVMKLLKKKKNEVAELHISLHFLSLTVIKPQKGCRLEICFGVQKGNNHPSGLVQTAANEKSKGSNECGAAAGWSSGRVEQRRGLPHLRAVLLVRSERPVKHDHPVSVEAQPNRLLCDQLGPSGCQLHETLSFAGQHIQFPYPLQQQVKVHAEVGSRSTCAG